MHEAAHDISRHEALKLLNGPDPYRSDAPALFLTMGNLCLKVPGGHLFISARNDGELTCQFAAGDDGLKPKRFELPRPYFYERIRVEADLDNNDCVFVEYIDAATDVVEWAVRIPFKAE